MKMISNPIVITTLTESEVIRIKPEDSVEQVLQNVYAAIYSMYENQETVLEEFIECGELQIEGLPLNLQVLLFARLKHDIDGDEIYIEGFDGAFPTMKLIDYLESGPCIPQEDNRFEVPWGGEEKREAPWDYSNDAKDGDDSLPEEMEFHRPGDVNTEKDAEEYVRCYLEQDYNHPVESFNIEFDARKIYVTNIKWGKEDSVNG